MVAPLIDVESRVFQIATDCIPSRGTPDAPAAIALRIICSYIAVDPA
jgi:hypothetical protein